MPDFRIGYNNDVGTEITLDEDIVFKAHELKTVGLKTTVSIATDSFGLVCPRSSAASKGLFIATCPIDPDYNGEIHAVVYNCSNEDVVYKAGEAFCQIVVVISKSNPFNVVPKKGGRRTNGAFGSTDVSSN